MTKEKWKAEMHRRHRERLWHGMSYQAYHQAAVEVVIEVAAEMFAATEAKAKEEPK